MHRESAGLQRNFLVPPSGIDPSRKPSRLPALGFACCSLARGERGMRKQRPPHSPSLHIHIQRYQAERRDCWPLEGQVAPSSLRPFPWLQGDSTGHSETRNDAPAKGCPSCHPHRRDVLLTPAGCPPPAPAPRSSPRQVPPAAMPPLPLPRRPPSPLLPSGLPGPRGAAVPHQPPGSAAGIPGPFLQT